MSGNTNSLDSADSIADTSDNSLHDITTDESNDNDSVGLADKTSVTTQAVLKAK